MTISSIIAQQHLELFVRFGTDHVDGSQMDEAKASVTAEYNQRDPAFRDRIVHDIREFKNNRRNAILRLTTWRGQVSATPIIEMTATQLVAAFLLLRETEDLAADMVEQITTLHRMYTPVARKDSIFLANLGWKLPEVREFHTSCKARVDRHELGVSRLGRKTNTLPYARRFIEPLRRQYTQAAAVANPNRELANVPLKELGPDWHAIGTAHGGLGNVIKFVKDDGDGNIEGRLVQKDTHITSDSTWTDPVAWYGEVNRRIPMEWYVHHRASRSGAARRNRYILEMFSDRPQVSEANRTHRFLMEYAPYGDLCDVQRRYMDADTPVPESFILYLFKALVEGCLVMEQGSVRQGRADWEEIVHRDLKPENIFMGPPQSTCFPNFPEPKLADFGLAIITTGHDAFNPYVFIHRGGAGTPGHMAPEQIQFVDSVTQKPVDDFKLHAPCNIWGIGVIIYGLMDLHLPTPHDQPSYLHGQSWRYNVSPMARMHYDRDLCAVVDACMAFDPHQRPTPSALHEWILQKLESRLDLFHASTGQQNPTDTLMKGRDDYQLGMAVVRAG